MRPLACQSLTQDIRPIYPSPIEPKPVHSLECLLVPKSRRQEWRPHGHVSNNRHRRIDACRQSRIIDSNELIAEWSDRAICQGGKDDLVGEVAESGWCQ